MLNCASLHTQYIYSAIYQHIQLCLTTYIVELHGIVLPCSGVLQYIHRIAKLYFTAMLGCAPLRTQYSYTVLYRLVLLCLTICTIQLHGTEPPCLALLQYMCNKFKLYCNAMFTCAPLHTQYIYNVSYGFVQLCLTNYTI